MALFSFEDSGDFGNFERWAAKVQRGGLYAKLESVAERGRAALAAATPVDTGATAASWSYEIEINGANAVISWTNNHLDPTGTPIVVMRQHGHATGTGGYVQGLDFINPAMKAVFQEAEQIVTREVNS
jgi:hypothetical protein